MLGARSLAIWALAKSNALTREQAAKEDPFTLQLRNLGHDRDRSKSVVSVHLRLEQALCDMVLGVSQRRACTLMSVA